MRTTALAAAAAAAALTLTAGATAGPATARNIAHEHFTDVFTSPVYDCGGLVMAQDSGVVHVDLSITQHAQPGSGGFPYFRENVHGTIVTTNQATGGTYTQKFTSNSHDHTILDNGDGTITVTIYASGGARYYDQFGTLVLKDPGNIRFAFDLDYHGTPGNPTDDTEIEGSFHIVRDSTGLNETDGRDFCEDVLLFTSAP
jgi:hypothetical protein